MALDPERRNLDLRVLSAVPVARNAIEQLVAQIKGTLGDELVGIYFDGSLALGDFHAMRSDIDLVVVTRDFLTESAAAKLEAVHAVFARSVPTWGEEIEVIYVTGRDLDVRSVQDGTEHRYVERGTGGQLQTGALRLGWLIHLRVLSRNGITITGRDIRGLVADVEDETLRRAAAIGALDRLRLYQDNPGLLERPGARAFAVLTACRMLYTFRTGNVVPKMEAANATLQHVDASAGHTIQAAMSWRKDGRSFTAGLEDTLKVLELVRGECTG
jgi:predicted nucleotidyltransferase